MTQGIPKRNNGKGLLSRFLLILVLLAGLVSCSGEEPRKASGFELETLEGESRALHDRDADVLLVNFWASWCAPCRQEMPQLDALYREYRDRGFAVWGVNVDTLPENAREFAGEVEVSYPLLLDNDMAVAEDWGVQAMPSTFIVDTAGDIRHTKLGYDADAMGALEDRIRELLAEGGDNG